MSELGSGSGSSFPSALDTNAVLEVNSPSGSKTKARAEVPNDHGAAIVAVQTELGTDPAGTKADVKTYLQTEHDAAGAHTTDVIAEKTATSGVTIDGCLIKDGVAAAASTAVSLTFGGEASATGTSTPLTLDLGTLADGDRIFISVYASSGGTGAAAGDIVKWLISKNSGTGVVQFIHNRSSFAFSGGNADTPNGFSNQTMSIMGKCTTAGTYVLQVAYSSGSGTVATHTFELYAFLMKDA